jgi:hypothetical protein
MKLEEQSGSYRLPREVVKRSNSPASYRIMTYKRYKESKPSGKIIANVGDVVLVERTK